MADQTDKLIDRVPSGANDCLCLHLRKAARAVTQVYDDHLREAGLRVTQFSLLAALAGQGPLTVQALAEHLVMDRTTLSRNLRLVVKAGLVDMAAGADRRTRLVALSAAGRRRLGEALPAWRRAQTMLTGRLGDDTAATLRQVTQSTVRAARGQADG